MKACIIFLIFIIISLQKGYALHTEPFYQRRSHQLTMTNDFNGKLLDLKSSSTLFYIENGKSRRIKDMALFTQLYSQ